MRGRKFNTFAKTTQDFLATPTGRVVSVGAFAAGACLAGRSLMRRSRRIDLNGKVALVTGGSRGLGLVLARELIEQGCKVAICARDEEELDRARRDLLGRTANPVVLAVQCDVTSEAQVEDLVDGVGRHFGPVDLLFNNAGVIQVGPAEHMTVADFDEAMRLHFWAPLYATRAVLPDMIRRRTGRIVNVASIGGKIPAPHLLPYTASKFALVGLSEGLRAELKEHGIYVTTVAPGLMRTGSPGHAFFKGRHREEHAWFTIADALPLFSMDARRAGRRIVRAARDGEAEVILTFAAKAAAAFHGLFPSAYAELAALANSALPRPGGIGRARTTGDQSQSSLAPSLLTTLSDRAAAQNNETGGPTP